MKITKKSITLLLAGLLCASNSFSQTYPKQDGVIRLLTYNTHYCKGGTDPGSLNDLNTKRFANILKVLDADVVALQELDSAANGRWKRVLLDDIAKWSELDYVQVYGIAADYDGGSVGNGTLVKRWLPIKKIKKMKLGSDVGRILIRTDFEDFSFMSTHLDLDDNNRMQEAAAICTELDYIRKPVFLAGDMNDSHMPCIKAGTAPPCPLFSKLPVLPRFPCGNRIFSCAWFPPVSPHGFLSVHPKACGKCSP